jgi:hypothetical protein
MLRFNIIIKCRFSWSYGDFGGNFIDIMAWHIQNKIFSIAKDKASFSIIFE